MAVGQACMFFAGLILLIPHRIGMSRVNYVIKRYNLPISRAGLLLYKYHNNIELSLTLGTLPGNIIVWCVGMYAYESGVLSDQQKNKKKNEIIKWFMFVFLILMLISSIYMFIIYVSGGDFGHLNAFYFSLIFLTLFDGFTNAFAFGLNPGGSSMLSAGIPLSGFLVTLLHYTYKFYSDKHHWDDFDYYVLRLQLICNIIIIIIALGFWSWDTYYKYTSSGTVKVGKPQELLSSHIYDWSPICLLAISLGTVYAFYPSIAPYSIIDFQYASVIELWILIISALLPIVIALLDTNYTPTEKDLNKIIGKWGPSGKEDDPTLLTFASTAKADTISFTTGTGGATKDYVKFTGQTLTLSNIKVRHPTVTDNKKYHSGSTCGASAGDETKWHDWNGNKDNKVTYIIQNNDEYWASSKIAFSDSVQINNSNYTLKASHFTKYKYYSNCFSYWNNKLNPQSNITSVNLTITAGTQTSPAKYDEVTYTNLTSIQVTTGNNVSWSYNNNDPAKYYSLWNLVWISAIFYILCIQIFMSMLHYPHCLLSCFFSDNPYCIVFISILFNTLRELMQACAFSGAGKQCNNLDDTSIVNAKGTVIFNDIASGDLTKINFNKTAPTNDTYPGNISASTAPEDDTVTGGYDKVKLKLQGIKSVLTSGNPTGTYSGIYAEVSSFKIDTNNPSLGKLILDGVGVNGTIAATNKLITLFVMMFCVFTGDGYLQHYRRCCRDCWPTTGYNKYQSFFYWLRFGFKGGIKSITSSFTDLYYHNLRPQFISYA